MTEEGDLGEHMSEESVRHLVFREEPAESAVPLYRSKFSSQVRKEVVKECHRTMGLPSDFFITFPCEYLRKNTRKVVRPDIEKCFHPSQVSHVPRHDEAPPKPAKPANNYVLANIRRMNNAVPKTGPSRYYDQATNQKYHNCVLKLPKFVHDKGFGKVPKYLIKGKREKEKEAKELQEKESLKQSTLKQIPEEEREKLIKGLKQRWTETQKEFQLLPMLNDTPPQIKRKLKLERELASLEKQIDYLERNQMIFIYTSPSVEGSC